MFYTKRDLEKAVSAAGASLAEALIVSQDRPNADARTFSGKKQFFFCRDAAEYLERLQSGEHMHEVLADKFQTRSWVYMDIDEECAGDAEAKERKTMDYVRKVARAFTLSLEDVGTSIQVLTSHAPHKLSVHVVIYIASFPAEVAVHMERVDKSVPWDPSVYSMFRSYRAPYHRKGGKEFRLIPWRLSSSEMADHLIRILPGDHRRAVTKLSAVSIPEPRRRALELRRREPRAAGDPCRAEAIALLAGTNLARVIKSESLERSIGSASRKAGTVFAYIERGFACPFKGDSHRSNRAFVTVAPGAPACFRCLSPACRGRALVLEGATG